MTDTATPTKSRPRPLIFSRRYVSPCIGAYDAPGQCDHCGRDLVETEHPRNCSSSCRNAVKQLSHEQRSERRAATPAGVCVNCGRPLRSPTFRCPRARNAWIKGWRGAAGGKLRFGAEAWEWFGGKVGLEPTDERLPAIAMQLARARRLAVLVDGGKGIVGIARAKGAAR